MLRELQEAYQAWLDNLPESLQGSPLAEKLEVVCALDLEALEVDLPLGFGRDSGVPNKGTQGFIAYSRVLFLNTQN